MSISSQITRLQNAKSDLKTSINNKLIDNKITNETIDDYADKVDEIMTPQLPLHKCIVNGTVDKGKVYDGTIKAILKNDEHWGIKLNKNYFLTYGYNENSKKYVLRIKQFSDLEEEPTIVTEEEIPQELLSVIYFGDDYYLSGITSDNEIYYDGNYYYIPVFRLAAYMVVTDLENIYIVGDDNIDVDYDHIQIDYNKYVLFDTKLSGSNKDWTYTTEAKILTINYNGENTTFSVTNNETIMETQSLYQNLKSEVVPITKNRFIVCHNNYEYTYYGYHPLTLTLKAKIYSVSNNTISLIDSLEKTSQYTPTGATSQDMYYYKYNIEFNKFYFKYKYTDDKGCYQISDSGFAPVSLDPTYDFSLIPVCIYNFTLNEVMIGFLSSRWGEIENNKIYSLDGYNITEIQTTIPNRLLLSPITYHQLLQPTDDNYIMLSILGIIYVYDMNYNEIYNVNNVDNYSYYASLLTTSNGQSNDYIYCYAVYEAFLGYWYD